MHNKFGIDIKKHESNFWGFGVALSHMFDETYVHFELFKLNITIGKYYH